MKQRTKNFAFAAAIICGGCSSPLPGEWSTDVVANGRKSEMTLESDGTGDATIISFVSLDGEQYVAQETFDIDWQESGSDYELDMRCTGSDVYGASCGASDFTMDCELRGDDDELKCSGDRRYENYEFRWELD